MLLSQNSLLMLWKLVAKQPKLSQVMPELLRQIQQEIPIAGLKVLYIEQNPVKLRFLGSAGSNENIDKYLIDNVEGWLISDKKLHILPAAEMEMQILVCTMMTESGKTILLTLRCNSSLTLEVHNNLSEILSIFLAAAENELRLDDLNQLKNISESDKLSLLQRTGRDSVKDHIVGISHGLAETMHKVNLVAPSDSTVLILGETGSGKEVIARAIHQQSSRKDQPFIRVNCGAIPPELVDSELFGHEKGSFTGALENKKGWFERANRGTLFLDEVGELPLFAQVRLLRVLQEGTLTRVGAERETWVDVRIIAATHRDLQQHVHKGLFREDLWYRLHVFPIFIPPLRERVSDIPELATHFIKRASKKLGLPIPYITESQLQQLYEYSWPGNIREMQVVIERAVILGEGNRLELSTALGNINATLQTTPPNPVLSIESNTNQLTLDETIIIAIKDALKQSQGRVDGYFGAAKALNINPNTLRSKMRKYQITIEKKASN